MLHLISFHAGGPNTRWMFDCEIQRVDTSLDCLQFNSNVFSYEKFWDVNSIDGNRPFRNVALNIFLQGSNDSRILLSSAPIKPFGTTAAPYYEIVLGTNKENNDFEIWRNNERLKKESKKKYFKLKQKHFR